MASARLPVRACGSRRVIGLKQCIP
jgi:hypothetical protein